jgi:transposase
MLKKHEQLRIHDLLGKGLSVSEVVERTGASLGTVYKYRNLGRRLQGALNGPSKVPLEIEPYVNLVDEHLQHRKLKFKNLLFDLQQAGYKGSTAIAEKYYRERKQEIQPRRYLKHVETGKGEQGQVDWGHFGVITINNKPEKVYLFAYILSYSRAVYLEFVVRQNQKTLHECHIHAFEAIGIPKTIVYDNMKTVVSHRKKLPDGTENIKYTDAFMDFARYYQFEVFACPPYWPQTKGKVESTIKYVRHFFPRVSPNRLHLKRSMIAFTNGLPSKQMSESTVAHTRSQASFGKKKSHS